ncbi:hypothetical protein HK405_011044 [Cladochytrium tenue]|nr:hypothetical protein HK405_011044 [Cladochytrium tenue]
MAGPLHVPSLASTNGGGGGEPRVCVTDLQRLLQRRIDTLLEEDQSELARLLDDAMRTLGQFQVEEQTWQTQFQLRWTLGEKAADLVARFGGSWRFICALLAFLAAWMLYNGIAGSSGGYSWDAYPFILLNLMLSTLAALQAPVIMMSQNRQAQIDRLQSDYVAKIVLRAEMQVRHVNAKVDHLLSHQWKRLLEIQQAQADLLQLLQLESRRAAAGTYWQHATGGSCASCGTCRPPTAPLPESPLDRRGSTATFTANAAGLGASRSRRARSATQWMFETEPDDHATMLLALHFGLPAPYDDELVFAHRHADGDNYLGAVENVRLDASAAFGDIGLITYDIVLSDPTASLDDMFAGEGSVTLRNDMDIPHMAMKGRILRLEVHPRDASYPVASFDNGDLPTRHASSFQLRRADRIANFWRHPIARVSVAYAPPRPLAALRLRAGQRLRPDAVAAAALRADFFPRAGCAGARLWARRLDDGEDVRGDSEMQVLREVVAAGAGAPAWRLAAEVAWARGGANAPAPPASLASSSEVSSSPSRPSDATAGALVLSEATGPATALVSAAALGGASAAGTDSGGMGADGGEDVVGPCVLVFACLETRVAFHAVVEDVDVSAAEGGVATEGFI